MDSCVRVHARCMHMHAALINCPIINSNDDGELFVELGNPLRSERIDGRKSGTVEATALFPKIVDRRAFVAQFEELYLFIHFPETLPPPIAAHFDIDGLPLDSTTRGTAIHSGQKVVIQLRHRPRVVTVLPDEPFDAAVQQL